MSKNDAVNKQCGEKSGEKDKLFDHAVLQSTQARGSQQFNKCILTKYM